MSGFLFTIVNALNADLPHKRWFTLRYHLKDGDTH